MPPPSGLEITVETLTGAGYRLRLLAQDTALSVKARIRRLEGVPVCQQHLLLGGAELPDRVPLLQCGVTHGSRLQLVLSMRAGPLGVRRGSCSGSETAADGSAAAGSSSGGRRRQLLLFPQLHDDQLSYAELRQLCAEQQQPSEGRRRRQLAVLVFRDGAHRLGFYRVLENADGTFSPLSEPWSPEREQRRRAENTATRRRVAELRRRRQVLVEHRRLLRRRPSVSPGNGAAGERTQQEATTHTALEAAGGSASVPSVTRLSGVLPHNLTPLELTVPKSEHRSHVSSDSKTASSNSSPVVKPASTNGATGVTETVAASDLPSRVHFPPIFPYTSTAPPSGASAPPVDDLSSSFSRLNSESTAARLRRLTDNDSAVFSEQFALPPPPPPRNPSRCSGGGAVKAVRLAPLIRHLSHPVESRSLRRPMSDFRRPSDYGSGSSESGAGLSRVRPRSTPDWAGFRFRQRRISRDDSDARSNTPVLTLRPTDGAAQQLCRILSARRCSQQLRQEFLPVPQPQRAATQETTDRASTDAAPMRRKRPRCAVCRRRLGLAQSYQCVCGGGDVVYCSTHRYPETHGCSRDFKAEGRALLAAANPLVVAEKLPKI